MVTVYKLVIFVLVCQFIRDPHHRILNFKIICRNVHSKGWKMSEEYKDWTVPISDSELEHFLNFFKSLPSYKDEAISTKDFPALIKKGMRYERTPEQILAYQKYWDEKGGGKLTLSEATRALKSVHSTSKYFAQTYAAKFDTDGDGFISADEFKPMLELMASHDPTIAGISFEEFMEQADTNHDGKINIEECAQWIEKHSTSEST